jgi:LacI family transcriptional regulator
MLGPVEQRLRERGYRLAVCSDIEGILAEGRVDGAILLADPVTGPERFGAIGIPVAYVWSACSSCPGCISWNDADGAELAMRHLVSLGHSRIAGLFGDYPPDGAPPDKVAGFRAAASRSSADTREWLGGLASDQFENGYRLVRKALGRDRDWHAIFARNDYLALGAMRALREAGVVVPGQVAVVGYNDTELARFADPPLTSVRTPIADAGALAAVRLVEAVEGGSSQIAGEELPMRLTVRGSCGAGRAEEP